MIDPKKLKIEKYLGHYEIDTVIGAPGSDVLTTMIERTSRLFIMNRAPSKEQIHVNSFIDNLQSKLKQDFSTYIKSITSDNGTEFRDFKTIERDLYNNSLKRTSMFYADAYASSQRGSGENVHKLVRYKIPKGFDIARYSDEYINSSIHFINNYPRKILGYLSSAQVAQKLFGDKFLENLNITIDLPKEIAL